MYGFGIEALTHVQSGEGAGHGDVGCIEDGVFYPVPWIASGFNRIRQSSSLAIADLTLVTLGEPQLANAATEKTQ